MLDNSSAVTMSRRSLDVLVGCERFRGSADQLGGELGEAGVAVGLLGSLVLLQRCEHARRLVGGDAQRQCEVAVFVPALRHGRLVRPRIRILLAGSGAGNAADRRVQLSAGAALGQVDPDLFVGCGCDPRDRPDPAVRQPPLG
jgi:hypothetical protein